MIVGLAIERSVNFPLNHSSWKDFVENKPSLDSSFVGFDVAGDACRLKACT